MLYIWFGIWWMSSESAEIANDSYLKCCAHRNQCLSRCDWTYRRFHYREWLYSNFQFSESIVKLMTIPETQSFGFNTFDECFVSYDWNSKFKSCFQNSIYALFSGTFALKAFNLIIRLQLNEELYSIFKLMLFCWQSMHLSIGLNNNSSSFGTK